MTDLNALAERLESRALFHEQRNGETGLTIDLRQAAQALRGMGEADELLREVFDGRVDVALAGNPMVCDELQERLRSYFARSALKGGGAGG